MCARPSPEAAPQRCRQTPLQRGEQKTLANAGVHACGWAPPSPGPALPLPLHRTAVPFWEGELGERGSSPREQPYVSRGTGHWEVGQGGPLKRSATQRGGRREGTLERKAGWEGALTSRGDTSKPAEM